MSVRRKLTLAVIAPLFLVAACQADEPEPKMPTASPSASSSSPPTPTATVDPLAIPAAAKEPTKAGAEALIRHFWDMVNHLIETGDAKPARELFASGCDYCAAGVDYFESIPAKGHSVDGGVQSVIKVQASLLKNDDGVPSVYADVRLSSEAAVERDAQGKVVSRLPGGSSLKGYYLTFQNGRWDITTVDEALK